MSTVEAPPAAPAASRTVRPFGWRDKIGYMFGDFGNDFTFILQSFFFMMFYTNVMGINPAHVGTLLFAARILDAFTDVGMGRLVDTMKPGKAGRFKPWILRISVPVAAAGVLMFTPVLQDAAYGARLGWMIVTYVLWGSIFYTMINIPYGSMASVISNKPEDRAALSVFRSLGATLANLAISVVLPLIVYVQIDGQSQMSGDRMFLAAVGCGIAAVLCYITCFKNVEERIEVPAKSKDERMGFGTMMATLVSNRALTGLIAAALLMLVGMLLLGSMMPYMYNDVFNNGQLLSVVNFVGLVPTLLFVPLATPLAKRFGKRELGIVGTSISAVAGIVLFIVRTDSPYVFMVGYAVLMLGVAMVNVLIWAYITDVIDYQEIRTGERNDGTVYALYSWARKMGQALAGGLSGWALAWVGYQATTSGAVQQTEEALNGVYTLTSLVPAILLGLCALVLIFWYPLSKKRVDENVAILEKKHAAEAAAAEIA